MCVSLRTGSCALARGSSWFPPVGDTTRIRVARCSPLSEMTDLLRRHERLVTLPELPPEMADVLTGYACFRVVRSYPVPSQVYRCVSAGSPTFYLKTATNLGTERDRLRWLEGRLPVPRVVAYAQGRGQDFVLLTEMPGAPADCSVWRRDARRLVGLLAEGVHAVHSVPTMDCPFDASVDRLLDAAERAVRLGLVDQTSFSSAYRRITPHDLFKILLRLRPRTDRVVFTHGDCCLPNILIRPGLPAGFVDLGMAGLGDPHRDLALVAVSIRRNLGGRWVENFLRAYGLEPDQAKMEFYAILSEFAMTRPRGSR